MKIKKVLLLVLLLLFNSPTVFGSWVELSYETLVKNSNLAVTGEYIGSTRLLSNNPSEELIVGIIKVERVLIGQNKDDFLLIAIRKAEMPSISSTTSYSKGQKGMWLLNYYLPNNSLLYSASHPQQFISLNDKKTMAQVMDVISSLNQ